MKKFISIVLTIIFLIVGIVMLPTTLSENESYLPKEETLCESTFTSQSTCTTIVSAIKSGVPTDFVYVVYTTKTGKKYHSRKSCSGLSPAKAIYETPIKEATARGLTPCFKCC